MFRPSCANSLQQTSGTWLGFSRICQHSRAGSLYTGPSWKYAATNSSTKAHFQNHIRVSHYMFRSGEWMQRSASSPLLPRQFVWPVSAHMAHFSHGDGASIPSQNCDNDFSFSSSTHSRAAFYSHWLVGSLSRASLRDLGSPGQVANVFSTLPLPSQPWWSLFTPRVTQLGLVLSSSPSWPASSSSLSPVSPRPLLQSSMSLDPTSTARQRGIRSRSPFRSLSTSRLSPNPLKTPLVRMRPRVYTHIAFTRISRVAEKSEEVRQSDFRVQNLPTIVSSSELNAHQMCGSVAGTVRFSGMVRTDTDPAHPDGFSRLRLKSEPTDPVPF